MIKTMHKHLLSLAAAGLLLPALAGCSRSEPEDQPVAAMENDEGVTETVPESEAPPMVNEVETAPAMNMAEEAPPPPPARTADQQMMDDASATGMTARVQRDSAPTDAPTGEPDHGGQ